jgi:hypothetical protein
MEPYYEQDEPPPRRSHGCLWGCLTVLLVAGLVTAALFGYGAWYFFKGFENDTRIQTIMSTVYSDPRAGTVLGRNIRIIDVEKHLYNTSSRGGQKATYTLRLAGTEGEGVLKAYLDLNGPEAKVTLMVLTGTDGHPHYLVGKEPKSPFARSI